MAYLCKKVAKFSAIMCRTDLYHTCAHFEAKASRKFLFINALRVLSKGILLIMLFARDVLNIKKHTH